MESNDLLPEENLGTAEALRARAVEVSLLASGCDLEAVEQETSAMRLRTRAARLREVALELRNAAHAVDQTGTGLPPEATIPASRHDGEETPDGADA